MAQSTVQRVEDRRAAQSFQDGVMLKLVVSGARKQRAYRELCTYWGPCQYIADLNLSEYMDTQAKVNHITRVRLGFVDETFVDPKTAESYLSGHRAVPEGLLLDKEVA